MTYGTDRIHVCVQLATAVVGGVGLAAVDVLQTHRPFGPVHLHHTLVVLAGLPAIGMSSFVIVQLMRTTARLTETDVEL